MVLTNGDTTGAWMLGMTNHAAGPCAVRAGRQIAAGTGQILARTAARALQPRWDANGDQAEAAVDQRIRNVGDVLIVTLDATFGPR